MCYVVVLVTRYLHSINKLKQSRLCDLWSGSRLVICCLVLVPASVTGSSPPQACTIFMLRRTKGRVIDCEARQSEVPSPSWNRTTTMGGGQWT